MLFLGVPIVSVGGVPLGEHPFRYKSLPNLEAVATVTWGDCWESRRLIQPRRRLFPPARDWNRKGSP
jgi:hypothetical protein